jgi:dihydrodipicolinate synthase/N-acetylneuraminate lyase
MCQLQIEAGATSLVIGGTIGESLTLSYGEHAEIVTVAVDVANGCGPIGYGDSLIISLRPCTKPTLLARVS